MPVIRQGRIVAVMSLAASALAGATPVESTVRRIPARVAAHRFLVVPVTVNGAGPYPFLLDTGSTSSMVAADLARELALPPLGHAVQQTTTGAGSVDLVQATLTLGSVHREGDVISAALGAVREMDPAIRGIVGQDLLRLGNWWLDYRGRSLVQDAAGALGQADLGERLSVHWHGDRPAIDTVLPDRRPLRLVLDSAASSAILFGGGHAASEGADDGLMTTLDDRLTVRMASVGPLQAGRAAIPRFAAAMLAGVGGRTEDGLLPTALFEGVYFDNRAGAVVLNPRRSTLSAVP